VCVLTRQEYFFRTVSLFRVFRIWGKIWVKKQGARNEKFVSPHPPPPSPTSCISYKIKYRAFRAAAVGIRVMRWLRRLNAGLNFGEPDSIPGQSVRDFLWITAPLSPCHCHSTTAACHLFVYSNHLLTLHIHSFITT